MAKGAELVVKIITDAAEASKGIEQAEGKFSGFNNTMGKLVGPAVAVLGGITALGVGALESASQVEQAMGGIDAVFGDSAGKIKEWGKEAATAAGLSEAAYGQLATTMGAQLKNMGVPMDQVADKTGSMIQLGADLAAQFGGSSADAVAALSSALRGEADPAEKYGLALSQTAVNAELAARGLDGLTGDQLAAAKAAVIMEMATTQAGGAVGAYSRESDTLAGSQQTLAASWENAAAALGTALLPVITPVVQALAEFAQWVGENSTLVGIIIGIIAALAAIVLVYAAAQWVANAAMFANPVGLIIAGIVALIAIITALVVVVIQHWAEISAFFMSVWAAISAFFMSVMDAIVAAWNAVVASFQTGMSQIGSFFSAIWAAIVAAWNAVVSSFKTGMSQIGSFFSSIFNAIAALVNSVFAGIRAAVSSVAQFFVSAWQNAVAAVSAVIRTLQGIFASVMGVIQGAINGVVGAFNAVVNAVKNVINWISQIKIPNLGGLFGGSRSAAPAAASLSAAPTAGLMAYSGPRVGVLTARAAGGLGGNTFINVQGGLDSADAIARRITQVLRQRDQRAHGVTITRSAR